MSVLYVILTTIKSLIVDGRPTNNDVISNYVIECLNDTPMIKNGYIKCRMSTHRIYKTTSILFPYNLENRGTVFIGTLGYKLIHKFFKTLK